MNYAINKNETKIIFDSIYHRYDLANDILSLGLHRHWRRMACRDLNPDGGDLVLDLATGTGACARELLRRNGAKFQVVGLDSSLRMVEQGRRIWKENRRGMLVLGEMEKLPFRNSCFQRVILSFGIRNSWDMESTLREMGRVISPGGKAVILEFSEPTVPLICSVYHFYLCWILPEVGGWVTGKKALYQYLAKSIIGFGSLEKFRAKMEVCGWHKVRYRTLCGGIVTIYKGLRKDH